MKATEDLENDHVHILRLCDVMERMSDNDNIDPAQLENVVSLIRNFADGLHHKKEEDLLFPKMAEKGFSPTQGPVAVMLHEHEEGRKYVRGIAENIPLYISGDKGALKTIVSNMVGYAGLLKNHIAKENNILFRMADNALSGDEQEALLVEFGEAEKSLAPGGSASAFISRIDELAKIYGVR
jgi:hemerythrin-like domain-containing protein